MEREEEVGYTVCGVLAGRGREWGVQFVDINASWRGTVFVPVCILIAPCFSTGLRMRDMI